MNPGEETLAMVEARRGLVRGLAAGLSRSVLRVPLLSLLLVSMALLCSGQNSGQSTGRTSIHDQASPDLTDDGLASTDQHFGGNAGDAVFMERRMRQLNAVQHKAMVSDTDRLVKLVNELNAEISDSTPKALTSEQIRKVAEIEKLAHSVKDKMRISVLPVPSRFEATPRTRSN